MLRAITMAVLLLVEPPGWDMPPRVEAGRLKSEARCAVVCFSMRVSTGETW